MSFVGFSGISRAVKYVIKGAEIISAAGTIYDIFDGPRKAREEQRLIVDRVDAKVDDYMEYKVERTVNAKIDAKLAEHDVELLNKINDRLAAVAAAQEMRKNKKGDNNGNGQHSS
jgi:hypothetical protein